MRNIFSLMGKREKRRLTGYWKLVIAEGLVVVICALLSRVRWISDYYVEHFFHWSADIYGRLTNLFSFSVGEVLISLAVLFILTEILLLLFLASAACYKRIRCVGKNDENTDGKTDSTESIRTGFISNCHTFTKRYSKGLLVLILFVIWLMIMNCSALFRTSKLNINGNREKVYGQEQICILRNFLAEKCNELSQKMERDSDGNVNTEGDIDEKVRTAMRALSKEFPRLAGFYPRPKPMFGSYMMYQSGYDGVYFPFTMEANYNRYISDIRYPHVVSHELAHLKGFIYEDEADFIAYLACTGSEDEQLQYAGYLAVLNYVESDYQENEQKSDADVSLLEQVYYDAGSYTEKTRENLEEKKAVIPTETVETMGEEFTDTYMDYYESTQNYDEVTKLLLAYYDGVLY